MLSLLLIFFQERAADMALPYLQHYAAQYLTIPYLWPGQPPCSQSINVGGKELKFVENFCYLGGIIAQNGRIDDEITARISKAGSAWSPTTSPMVRPWYTFEHKSPGVQNCSVKYPSIRL